MLLDEPAGLLGLDTARLDVTGPADVVASPYAVTTAITAAIGCAALALSDGPVALDTRDAVATGASEGFLRIDGARPDFWAPLSGLARARDGWVRLHANYPHHAEALCRVLGIEPAREQLEAAVAGWDRVALEDALAAAGGVGVAVRTPKEWAGTAAAQAIPDQPLLAIRDGARGQRLTRTPRVLDLTRVIAGPVCTKALALHGCDVLRVDRPDRPEQVGWADVGVGKRTAFADLRGRLDLLDDADVAVVGYRADAMPWLRERLDRPGLVVVELDAWGWSGPWRDRRGFDSLVQAATGMNVVCGSAEEPGTLPFQLLDHATGWLAAACAGHGLRRLRADGVGTRYRLSLARTAAWVGAPREIPSTAGDLAPSTVDLGSGYGTTTVVSPPYVLGGSRPGWTHGAHLPGADEPRW